MCTCRYSRCHPNKKRKTSGAEHQHILKGKLTRLAVPLESLGLSKVTSEMSFHSIARDKNTSTDTCMPNSHTYMYSESENISSSAPFITDNGFSHLHMCSEGEQIPTL